MIGQQGISRTVDVLAAFLSDLRPVARCNGPQLCSTRLLLLLPIGASPASRAQSSRQACRDCNSRNWFWSSSGDNCGSAMMAKIVMVHRICPRRPNQLADLRGSDISSTVQVVRRACQLVR
jgi:hypothetical protein